MVERRRAKRGEAYSFALGAVSPDHDDCVLWPFGKTGSGYPAIWDIRSGNSNGAHRFVCELRNGPPPFPDAQATHSCTNALEGCVSGNHLSWQDAFGNMADKKRDGTIQTVQGSKNVHARLTNSQVREIRKLATSMPYVEIAKAFGVSDVTVGNIHRRKTWGWLED